MRLIEFACISGADKGGQEVYYLSTFVVKDIQSITAISERTCIMQFANRDYILIGSYRALVNRWKYAMNINQQIETDPFLFPSSAVRSNPKSIFIDDILLDHHQIQAYFKVIRPGDLYENFISL